jgi:cold shock CspA family protein
MPTSGELPGLSRKISTAMLLKKKSTPTFIGTIVYYEQTRGLGCIQYTNNNNEQELILFLQQTLQGTFTQQVAAGGGLQLSQSVSFNIRNTNNGPLAINVQIYPP